MAFLEHPATAEYTLFSSKYRMCITDHNLDHKTNLDIFKTIRIIQNMYFDHNGIKQINNRMTIGKSQNTWKLNSTLINNPWVKNDISKGKNRNEDEDIKICGLQLVKY